MRLSVACTFDHGLIARLSLYPEVHEVYGKMRCDAVGGGRSSYTLGRIGRREIVATVAEAHRHGIRFNYLLNAASLGGLEQTRSGHRRLRRLLDFLVDAGVDGITVASPFLLKLVKAQYSRFRVRIGVFAGVDSPHKARQWEDLGADTICVSAISCNRNFHLLRVIRDAVRCRLELIANASCITGCSHESAHMHLLSDSSRSGKQGTGGFCLDYCFLHCSHQRLRDPVNFIRAAWIRPEDLTFYEGLGYHDFKIVDRSCPPGLLISRVQAYVNRRFDGNLLQIVGPTARITAETGASLSRRIGVVLTLCRPWKVRIGSLKTMQKFAREVIPHRFESTAAPVYIDNRSLDGFLEGLPRDRCEVGVCRECDYCREWASRVVNIDGSHRQKVLALAEQLENGCATSAHWR